MIGLGRAVKLLIIALLVCVPLSYVRGEDKKAKPKKEAKKSAKKPLKGYRRVRAIISRLEAIQRGLLERGQGQSWLMEGHIRTIHYASTNWESAKEYVKAYNKLIAQLVKEPIGSFITHPGALVKVAQVIRWGQEVAIGLPHPLKKGFIEVKVVLAAPDEKAKKKAKKPEQTKNETKKTNSDKKS